MWYGFSCRWLTHPSTLCYVPILICSNFMMDFYSLIPCFHHSRQFMERHCAIFPRESSVRLAANDWKWFCEEWGSIETKGMLAKIENTNDLLNMLEKRWRNVMISWPIGMRLIKNCKTVEFLSKTCPEVIFFIFDKQRLVVSLLSRGNLNPYHHSLGHAMLFHAPKLIFLCYFFLEAKSFRNQNYIY